jgi:cob(I)alamin adenosyltransferase
MLYTGKGDKGTTKLFNTPQGERVPKTSPIFDALGTVDELVAMLGVAKVKADAQNVCIEERTVASIIHEVQETLFILQAELAGAEMSIPEEKTEKLNTLINTIEATLPPIKTFFIAGGTEGAAYFDVCRTVARRMERNLLKAKEGGTIITDSSLMYANRLSSLLYALARLFNHFSGITETPPSYK